MITCKSLVVEPAHLKNIEKYAPVNLDHFPSFPQFSGWKFQRNLWVATTHITVTLHFRSKKPRSLLAVPRWRKNCRRAKALSVRRSTWRTRFRYSKVVGEPVKPWDFFPHQVTSHQIATYHIEQQHGRTFSNPIARRLEFSSAPNGIEVLPDTN